MPTDDFLALQLQRLNLLLHREILRLRAAYQLALDEFRGLYISDEQIDSLIAGRQTADGGDVSVEDLGRQAEILNSRAWGMLEAESPWRVLGAEFRLTPLELNILLMALAPEIDLKYETLYAYLNNDITRKYLSVDLALRMVGTGGGCNVLRRLFLPDAALISEKLLRVMDSPQPSSSLSKSFTISPPVMHFLLGFGLPVQPPFFRASDTRRLNGGLHWGDGSLPAAEQVRLKSSAEAYGQRRDKEAAPCLIFEGRSSAGRRRAAADWCTEAGCELLGLDLESARSLSDIFIKAVEDVIIHSRLGSIGLYLSGLESLFNEEGKPLPDSNALAGLLTGWRGPLFIACSAGADWRRFPGARPTLCFRFQEPDYTTRIGLWQAQLTNRQLTTGEQCAAELAGRFVLNAEQIETAATSAAYGMRPDGGEQAATALLFQAAKQQSSANLGNLAAKLDAAHGFSELVLPANIIARLKNLTAAIRNRHIVYSEWGFSRRIGTGKGVKALFTGGTGTGKTMTAGVIAAELQLDIYKIDLSGIVSKYIGETEKNLDKIFQAAQAGNAILFFDEADALFGKRSEVKDAHDRYANIEVAYLLQKIEDHDGVVILASNLGKNMDMAFSRRLHYTIEFPMPDEPHRERLWRGMFPPEAPLAADVDFRFLARQFNLVGGDIKNVALDAAFLAAQDGQVVGMKQLANAMASLMLKQGRMPTMNDFKQYYELIVFGE